MIKLLTRYLKKSLYRNNNERKALLRNILWLNLNIFFHQKRWKTNKGEAYDLLELLL